MSGPPTRSFRLYANELEAVKELRQYCQSLGLNVKTQEDRIQSVLRLDKALGRFLVFIIVAGGLGGTGALFSGIYLSIQRSRRQFAVLQILGIPRIFVVISSIIQSQAIVVFGFLASFLLFHIGSTLLAGFLDQGNSTSRVCDLSGTHWFLLLACSLGFAIIATLLASTGIQVKDPAVVARSE